MSESSGYTPPSSRLPKEPLIVAALIVVVSVTIAVGGIVFKTKDSIQRDKVEFLADANQKQVAPLRRVIQLRLAQDKARLIQFAATRSALGPGRSRVFGDFALVSLLTPGAGGQWGLSWIEKGPLYPLLAGAGANLGQPSQASLTANQEVALLKSLPYDRIREGDIYWQRLSDSSGRPVWALAVSVETQARAAGSAGTPGSASLPEGTDYKSVQVGTGGRAVVVGFFGRNPLLSATEDFIGSTSTAFVIDSRGYAATHSNKAMVGSLLKDDPAVKEVFSARSSAGATRYQAPQGLRIFSAFEQVDRSNLYVVMSTPETITASSGQSFGRTAVTTGLLALVVGLFMVFAWGAKLIPRAAALAPSQALRIPGAGEPVTGSFGAMPVAEYGRPNYSRGGVPSTRVPTLELPDEYTREPKKKTSSLAGKITTSASENAVDRAAFVGRFVQGLERGMKEPLLAAMAHVQLVKVKSGDAPSKETMQEIAEHVTSVDRDLRRAKDMIDELGQLASQAGAPMNDERADLNRILTSTADQLRSEFSLDGIALRVETVSVPLIRGSEEPLRKIFDELLKNSRRALKGRTGKTITLRLVDSGDTVTITVKDNGVGMDRESRAQAFEPFFHGFDEPEARGLGLAMVRSAVASHAGTIDIESAPGDGTTMVLQFPVLASERTSFEKQPVKVEASSADVGMDFSISPSHDSSRTIDFGREGGVALGGKVPLSAESASGLPPSPRFGADDEDEKWSFRDSPKPELGEPETVVATQVVHQEMSENTQTVTDVVAVDNVEQSSSVKIRPVRRG